MTSIHPTAIVDAAAELDATVSVGPYAVIGAGVRIEAGTTVGAFCVIEGPTSIGRDNQRGRDGQAEMRRGQGAKLCACHRCRRAF